MNRIVMVAGLGWLCCFAGVAARAADSGPAAGASVPEMMLYAVTGDVQNEPVDITSRRGGRPTLYCFIPHDRWSRPTARLLRKLDESLPSAVEDSAIVAVWLTSEPVALRDYLPRAQQSLQLSHTWLTIDDVNADGPPEWGINREVDLTVVAARDGKVVKSFALTAPNDTLAEELIGALK